MALEKQFLLRLKIILQSNYFYFIVFILLFFFVFIKTKVIIYESKISSDIKEITAKITSYKIDGDKISFWFQAEENFIGTYYIKSEKEKIYLENNLKTGLELDLLGEINEISNNSIPNTFNYKKYLYNKKIYTSFLINKIIIKNTKLSFFQIVKNKVLDRIKKLNNNPYLEAFILGDKSLMKRDIEEKIQDNGVSHLFALSGMHLSFIYLFLDKVLKKVKFHKIFIYIILFCYLIIASFPVSFIRAILFTGIIDLNKKLSFNLSKIKVLFLVAAFLLFYNPFYLYDMGFVYTFVVTFSLLFCHNLIQNKNKFQQIIMVSIITFLFSAPITIYNSYEINILSILNNIILVPFVSIIVFPLAIITFIFPLLLPLFNVLTNILENLNHLLSIFSYFLIMGKITIIEILIYYLLLMIALKMKIEFLIVLIFYLLFLYNKDFFIRYSSVYFLDVGQGDATLFVSKQNKEIILIDTGGKVTYKTEAWKIRNKEFNLADNILTFLKSKRIRQINLLIITHGDLDHIGYASDLIEKIKIKKVMINQGSINFLERKIINKVKQVTNYQSKYFNYQNIKTKQYDNENDNSLISFFQIEKFSFLLMGDASKKVELELLKKYNLKAYFLKLGHHGSKTSSDELFLNEIKPFYAIISAGRNNRFNHPSQETLDILNRLKINILSTKENGTIEIRIGKNYCHIFKTIS